MANELPHTQPTPVRHTTEFMKLLPLLGTRYLGRGAFMMLRKLHVIDERKESMFTAAFSGLLAAGMTVMHAFTVRKDIWHAYAETVALEFDKNPQQVTRADFKKSENVFVKQALKNSSRFNLIRFGSLLGFLVPFIPVGNKELNVTDATNNVTGKKPFNYLADISPNGDYLGMGTLLGIAGFHEFLREETPHEVVRNFLQKFRPEALGQTITETDLLILYQAYAKAFDPDNAFTGINDTDKRNASQLVFSRAAYLIEHSYRNQPVVEDVASGKSDVVSTTKKENFQLPKFLHLLGNNLITISDPPKSLAYIEIANAHGIGAVKEVAAAIKNGASLERCLEKYPVHIPGESDRFVRPLSEKEIMDAEKFKLSEPMVDRASPRTVSPIPTARCIKAMAVAVHASSAVERLATQAAKPQEVQM